MSARSATAGRCLRAARNGAGVSQRTLAAHAGVSRTTLGRWERGQQGVTRWYYEFVVDALVECMFAEAERAKAAGGVVVDGAGANVSQLA